MARELGITVHKTGAVVALVDLEERSTPVADTF
jgi:hypothetical protein